MALMTADAVLEIDEAGGTEVLILAGSVAEGGNTLQTGGWLRLPHGHPLSAKAGAQGAKVWVKTGHLAYAKAPAV